MTMARHILRYGSVITLLIGANLPVLHSNRFRLLQRLHRQKRL